MLGYRGMVLSISNEIARLMKFFAVGLPKQCHKPTKLFRKSNILSS